MKNRLAVIVGVLTLTLFALATANGQENAAGVELSSGVARISLIHGDVSTQRGDSGDWIVLDVDRVGRERRTGRLGRFRTRTRQQRNADTTYRRESNSYRVHDHLDAHVSRLLLTGNDNDSQYSACGPEECKAVASNKLDTPIILIYYESHVGPILACELPC